LFLNSLIKKEGKAMPEERKFKRRCVICRRDYWKQDLVRIRQSNLGVCLQWKGAIFDLSSALPSSLPPVPQGRSAYLCTSPECVSKVPLQKGRYMAQALRSSISVQALESLANTLQHPPTST
jgi:predicted RNA-binding protein YlxR (DUF448 family)